MMSSYFSHVRCNIRNFRVHFFLILVHEGEEAFTKATLIQSFRLGTVKYDNGLIIV